jgi:hypothetical protein
MMLRAFPRFPTFLVLAFTTATSLLSSGCGEKDVFDLGNQEGDTMSGPNRRERFDEIESKYSAKIIINDRSYDAEHGVNRILRFLAENVSTYAEQFRNTGVVEIEIADRFETQEVQGSGGKLRIRLNLNASEAEIRRYLGHFPEDLHALNRRTEGARKMGLSQIIDLRGLSHGETNDFMARAENAAKGLDFQTRLPMTFHQRLVISRVYAISSNAMYVPFDASEDGLRAFFGKSIDLAKRLKDDLAKATTATGVTVDFQEAVLTPDELTAGINNLITLAEQVRSASGAKRPILLGRRTETDAALIRSQGMMLVSFSATREELTALLALLDADSSYALQKQLAEFRALYLASGVEVTLDVSHFGLPSGTATPTTLERVGSILARLVKVASPSRLAGLQIRSLQSAPGSSSGSSGSAAWLEERNGVQRLFTRVDTGLSEDALTSVLSPLEGRHERNQRLRTQRSMIESLWTRGSYRNASVSLEFTDDSLDTTSAEKTRILGAFLTNFLTVASANRLSALQIRRVVFVRNVTSEQEFVIAVGGMLQIDPYQASAAQLEQALYDLEHPAPVPTPTSRPNPPRPRP